jgi:hypothetical protein
MGASREEIAAEAAETHAAFMQAQAGVNQSKILAQVFKGPDILLLFAC